MTGPDQNFWQRVRAASERILALDYDGTLAPFRAQRMEARPLPGVLELLRSILEEGTTRVAVVSGRSLAELGELLGGLSALLFMIGSHGWEMREPGGALQRQEPDARVRGVLERAFSLARDAGAKHLGSTEARDRVERKTASVAAHARGLSEPAAQDWIENVRRAWLPLAGEGMELLDFNGGVELRARGRNKGSAVLELVSLFPRAGIMVYLGDDATDEDAFRALPPAGVGIRVGAGATNADYIINGPAEVRDFLGRWDEEVRAGRQGGGE